MENGKFKVKANLHIKSIVNPREVVDITNPHFAYYRYGKLAVTENLEPLYISPTWHGQSKFFSGKKIQLNHYYTKSKEEFILRVSKGRADTIAPKNYNESAVNFEQETTNDYAIQKYLPKLKLAMGIIE